MSDRLHVVIVDDDPSILTLLSATLRAGLKAQVTTFASAEAALTGWDTLPAPSALLTDYSMPGMDGLELAMRIRARALTLPIVLLSAVEVQGDAPGVITKYLAKPCPPSLLLTTLRELLSSPVPAAPAAPSPRFAALVERYRVHLAEVLAQLPMLVADAGSEAGERALRDQLHQLSGTAGSYGFQDISEACIALRDAVVAHRPLALAADRLSRALGDAAGGK